MTQRLKSNFAKSCVDSFLDRAKGIVSAKQGGQGSQSPKDLFESSLQKLPTNSNTLFFLGYTMLQEERPNEAVVCLNKSLLLDPDYKAGYVNLAIGFLRQGEYERAIEVAYAGLARHPDSPHQHYHIAVAYCQLALQQRSETRPSDCGTDMEAEGNIDNKYCQLSLNYFNKARGSDEAKRKLRAKQDTLMEAPWLELDDCMVKAMEPGSEVCELILPTNIGWSVYSHRM